METHYSEAKQVVVCGDFARAEHSHNLRGGAEVHGNILQIDLLALYCKEATRQKLTISCNVAIKKDLFDVLYGSDET